jgi:hypothetical protein
MKRKLFPSDACMIDAKNKTLDFPIASFSSTYFSSLKS